MFSYEKLPTDVLLDFFNEINQNIIKGILSKFMYYELGLIITVMNRRGITINKPVDFEKVVETNDEKFKYIISKIPKQRQRPIRKMQQQLQRETYFPRIN
ncbi:hypothetical protein KW850_30195 [Bacillus sp. sid0103]|uniref:hypothetical protein n=1 Tax=Bacillus sp. sid0103 TaxID=2856337 RepID=UPI001C491025|nr:hypothetical protein [Bacillus sp. sid0103]MBV7509434.1 hypothetical protein [Bacillus sp. sid0103]